MKSNYYYLLVFQKAMIISQFILELVIISVFSMAFSCISGSYIFHYIQRVYKGGQQQDSSSAIFENIVPTYMPLLF